MITVTTSDSKLKSLVESKESFESPEELRKYLSESGEKDFSIKESQDNVTIYRVLKG